MLAFLIIIIGIVLLSSVLILSKYIDFAKGMLEQKTVTETRVIQFNQTQRFKRKQKQDIIIDIPVEEVKVLQYKGD